MGYYYDIGISLNKAAHDELTARAEQSANLKQFINDADLAHHRPADGDKPEAYLYHWNFTKWKSGWEEIDQMEEVLSSCHDDNDCEYTKVSVGEELNDNEIEGNFYDDPYGISIHRAVSYSLEDTTNPIIELKETPEGLKIKVAVTE